jgi:dTDP-glucose 4,6-dehydratase
MKRVLITGIGGAIGAHMMAHFMHNTDWEIVGIDSFRHKGYYDRLTRFCQNHPDWVPRLKVVPHDLVAPLTDRQIEAIGEVDYIINLASLSDVQGSIDDPVPFIRNNSDLMVNMLEYARDVQPEAFLHFSTDEVYGSAPRDDKGHPEWDTILPSNPYAASKAAQEAYAIAYWRSFGVPLIITNTMNNFGETQAPSKYPAMIQKNVSMNRLVKVHAASDGQIGTRYYLHSRNAADAVLFILQNTTPHLHDPGQIDRPDRYNIVGDKQVDNLELAQIIARLMGKELRHELVDFHSKQPGHDLHYGLDGTKLEALGWKAPISFEDSLKNTIEWQQRNKEWLK